MVYSTNEDLGGCPGDSTKNKDITTTALFPASSSVGTKISIDGMQSVRRQYQKQGFSKKASEIIMSAWRGSTKQQYKVHISRWLQYCHVRKIDTISVSIQQVIEFLTDQFTNGLGYSSINTARSALSAFGIMLGQYPAGSHPTVIRFMRGVFNIRPLRSRYTEVWDVNKMLRYLRSLSPVKYLSLKDLTIKLTSLIALTNAARTQTLQLLSVHKLKKLNSKFVLFFDGLLKQSRPGNDFSFIELFAFPPDRRLCVFTVLKEYLRRTRVLRGAGETKLLLSYMKPHKPVTNHTISR